MIKSEMINELATALAKAQASIGGVRKDSKAYGYNYANLEAVIAAVKPALNDNGLSFVQLVEESDNANTVRVTTLLLHTSGQYIGSTGSTEIPEMKSCNLAQRAGAAQSYLKRYQLQALTGLPTEDNDASSDGFSKSNNNVESPKAEAKPSVVEQMKAAQTNPPAKKTTKFVAAKKDTPKAEASDELDL